MSHPDIKSGGVSARLKSGIFAVVFAFGAGACGNALAASPIEVELASPAQALRVCNAGSLPKGSVAYFNGAAGDAQYAKKCKQAVPTKVVRKALQVNGSQISECKLAPPKQAIALCIIGLIGEYDIAYVKGPVATVISGPGYGCPISQTSLSVGNAICE